MKKLLIIVVAAGLFWMLTGCHHPGPRFDPHAQLPSAFELETVSMTNRLDPEWLRPPAETFTLGPGDRLEIELVGDATTRTSATVGPDGKVYFYLLPGVDVWGMTLNQAKTRLEQELTKFIRDQAQISLSLRGVESRRVWVLGRLNAPGVYPMNGPMTLLEAISLAGGTLSLSGNQASGFAYSSEELADLRRSFVIRKGKLLPVDFHRLLKQGDLSQNIYLQPDDFVYLPGAAAKEVYVLGAVLQPRAVPYNDELTLVGAIAHAQGAIPFTQATINYASLGHVALVRGSLAEPRVAVVDYKEIVTGKRRDIALQPNDIIYVPYSPYRYLYKYVDLILQTFVSSVAINEGARAVLKEEPTPAGVFIPVGSRITITPTGGAPR
jgi:polysaccharide biosynthesis/export protein